MQVEFRTDVRTWRAIVDILSGVVDEASFRFDERGMAVRAINGPRTAMIDLTQPAEGFADYRSAESTVGLNLEELRRIAWRAKPSETMSFTCDGSRVVLTLSGVTTRRFTVRIVDIWGDSNLEIPRIEFTARAKLGAEILQEWLRDVELAGDMVEISITDEGFRMASHEHLGVELALARGSQDLHGLDVVEPTEAKFRVSMLQDIVRTIPRDCVVEVSLRTDHPFHVSYPLGAGKVVALVAPVIS